MIKSCIYKSLPSGGLFLCLFANKLKGALLCHQEDAENLKE